MKGILVFAVAMILAGCGAVKEKIRIESLSNQLGGLISDGYIIDLEREKSGAGYAKSYSADFVEADVHIFSARGLPDKKADAILENYLNQYYGGNAVKRKEATEVFRDVVFQSAHFVGHSNTKMFVAAHDDAVVQVILSWPLGYAESEREITEFMNALAEDIKGEKNEK